MNPREADPDDDWDELPDDESCEGPYDEDCEWF